MAGRIAAAVLGALVSLLTGLGPAAAKSDEESRSEYVITDRRLAGKLSEARDLLMEEEYEESKALLEEVEDRRLKPYARGLVHQLYGYIGASQENYEVAAEHFEKALATEALPPSEMSTMRFNLAQIQMMNDQWEKAVATLEEWFAHEEDPTPLAYYMLGIAYYEGDQPEKALEPARKAVDLSEDPRESWLQLLISLHVSDRRFEEALPLLERTALRYPKKGAWIQLAAVLMELERDEESLAVQQLAEAQGFLETDRELVRLAQMYVFLGMPWHGAELLRESLGSGAVESDGDAWELLANSLLAARENEAALGPLEQAAELAEDGRGYLRLGQVYMQFERWDEASDAIARAFEKGDLDNPAYAHLLAGITAFQQRRLELARGSFRRALGDARTQEMAEAWIQVVERAEAARERERDREEPASPA